MELNRKVTPKHITQLPRMSCTDKYEQRVLPISEKHVSGGVLDSYMCSIYKARRLSTRGGSFGCTVGNPTALRFGRRTIMGRRL